MLGAFPENVFAIVKKRGSDITMATKPEEKAEASTIEGTKIKWDDSNMRSAYANVCHVSSTREEVVLLFGLNQAWNRGQKEVTIQLTERVIVSPYAAKRLGLLLNNVVSEYENRFGALNVDAPPIPPAGGALRPKK
jgi:Protein of unknown function (DUF3467)